ncbi:hypothetical protein CTAYLR_010591 [Chrysophaeum taylorii]|uniref:P-type ATPase A domain-containing protein n=1 Tax=Chrysophaeum taylorii TaxID=2483200 RepID=A0AAD7XNP6_9STRA|nr:hypothetical protein CTAYLR_010591 [Chrysophaeum taylorii]
MGLEVNGLELGRRRRRRRYKAVCECAECEPCGVCGAEVCECKPICEVCGAEGCTECGGVDDAAARVVVVVAEEKKKKKVVRTKLSVSNICCEVEADLIKRLLGPLAADVKVNALTKVAIVEHACEPGEIVEILNRAHLGAKIVEAVQVRTKKKKWNAVVLVPIATTGVFAAGFFFSTAALWVGLACAGGSVALARALRTLAFRRRFDTNALVAIAVAASLFARDYLEAAGVAAAFCAAEVLQVECLRRVCELLELPPQPDALLVGGKNKKLVKPGDLKVGDLIAVRAGDSVPVDGRVLEASSGVVDESSLTGEALPVPKKPGDLVASGCVVTDGYLELSVVRTLEDSQRALREAMDVATSGGQSQALTQKLASVLVPGLVVTAAISLIWSLQQALAILVIACPCSLVMSAPLPFACTVAAAAKKGILISSGPTCLESVAASRTVAFDKTGTLTQGRARVVEALVFQEGTLMLAAALESKSSHPLAMAVVNYAMGGAAHATLPEPTDISVHPEGIRGIVEGRRVAVGSATFCGVESRRKTEVAVSVDDTPAMLFVIEDPIREEAAEVLRHLRRRRRRFVILTGDAEAPARAVGKALGIDEVSSGLSPTDKLEWVTKNKCVMIGDGTNDAPALKAATVGVAMTGTAVAVRAADVSIIADDFARVADLFDFSSRALRLVSQNIFISLAVKTVVVLLIFFDELRLSSAILADVASLLAVTLNGLRPLCRSSRRALPPPGNDDAAEDPLSPTDTTDLV